MYLLPFEIWKPIEQYEGYYEISSSGIIRGIERNVPHNKGVKKIPSKVLDIRVNNCGYPSVRLSKEGRTSTKFMHVLTATAFVDNPDNKSEVNHKNGNKLDFSIPNLEWNTHSENVNHAYRTGLIKPKATPVIDICTGQEFISAKEASTYYNIKHNTLRCYLNGGIKTNPTCLKYKEVA